MRPFIGPETLVISLLNGITSEGELAAAYGTEHVLYCVAQGMDAVKERRESDTDLGTVV